MGVALALALAVDAGLGELPALLHPVVWLGAAVRRARRLLFRPHRGPLHQLMAGALLLGAALAVSVGLVWSCGTFAARVHPLATFVVELFFIQASFAVRALLEAGVRMQRALEQGTHAGREALMHLCSRSADDLEPAELRAATIESLAENASDSVVAPLFWLVVGGVEAMVAYRVVNTLDAMVGYRGRYEYFGKAAARLDDLVNWVPARLTVVFLLVAGRFLDLPAARAWRVARSDAALTESPNAGWPMATVAGLLGVRLEKPENYVLGAHFPVPGPSALAGGLRLIRLASWLSAAAALVAIAATR